MKHPWFAAASMLMLVCTKVATAQQTSAVGPVTSYAGYPAVQLSNRLLFYRPTPTATDTLDIWIKRQSAFSGGAGDTNSAFFVEDYPGANDQSSNNSALVTMNAYNAAVSVAGYFQANRETAATAPVWALVADVRDHTDLPSSAANGHPVSSEQFDYRMNKADDASNGDFYGGRGVRGALGLIFSRYNTTDTTPAEMSYGFWIHSNTIGGSGAEPYAFMNSAIGFGTNTQIQTGLDTRGAIPPTGSSSPVVAVSMSAGQVIDFNGGPSLSSPPGATLKYNAGAIASSVPIQLPVTTVAALPTCSSALTGAFAAVSDAVNPTYNGTLTGGGSVGIPVYCNGTAWTAH